jgi:hypothetical protein
MAFEKLQVVVASGRKGMPASVTLTCQGGGGRPACSIALSQAIVTQAAFAAGDKFDLLVGTGDDQGVARLARSADGLITARDAKGGLKFWAGHIERFGTDSKKKQWCAAEIVDADTIEITLPPWAVD